MSTQEVIAIDTILAAPQYRVGQRVRLQTIPGRVREVDGERIYVQLTGAENAVPVTAALLTPLWPEDADAA